MMYIAQFKITRQVTEDQWAYKAETRKFDNGSTMQDIQNWVAETVGTDYKVKHSPELTIQILDQE